MSKAVKKKARRLKRTIRRTLGTLFLISALVVAAIPVDNLQAFGGTGEIAAPRARTDTVRPQSDAIPTLETDKNGSYPKIYTTEDTNLQFAYIQEKATTGQDAPWAVVLVGYNKGYVQNGVLNIPDTVDAYRQYTSNQGQSSGYVAVGRNGNFLFYRNAVEKRVPKNDPNKPTQYIEKLEDITEENIVYERYLVEDGDYLPCYLNDKAAWEGLKTSRIYYDTGHPTGDDVAAESGPNSRIYQTVDGRINFQRITNVAVNYICNQWYNESTGTWEKVTDQNKDKGLFAKTSNIVTLSLGKSFKGIGDYAFYGSGITSVEFRGSEGGNDGGNGLSVIGEGAFEECIQLH